MISKYLTKSLFIIGMQCPRKLYYTQHPDIYENKKISDPFLQALAQGGFQVGALAKVYHPEGIDLECLSTQDAIAKTNELLTMDKVTIFEAAIKHGDMLVKIDVLKKDGNILHLFEVKAKSYNATTDSFLDLKQKYIKSEWAKYLNDVAFQTYVLKKYAPDLTVLPYLTLVNKNVEASVDGVNQRFRLTKNDKGRTKVIVTPGTSLQSVGIQLLCDVPVAEEVASILSNEVAANYSNKVDLISFEEKIEIFTKGILTDQELSPRLDKDCKKCEFRCVATPPLNSGFEQCWGNSQKSTDNFVFDVWNFKGSDKILRDGRHLMRQLVESDFNIAKQASAGLTTSARQWLQVQIANEQETEPYLNREYLKNEINKWRYPLHCIDFETASVAIPFNAGRRPYEGIAFQFSHHTIQADGTVEHAGEYINVEPGVFPNFEFVRQLKKQLENDDGTIFRYSNHENTILCSIVRQLEASTEADKDELIAWIKTITYKKDAWAGSRNMIDLCDVVIKSFYHFTMRGSNSLKDVIPSILSVSEYLQNKYKHPIYGALNGIKSLNFNNHYWIRYDESCCIIDPYELLPKLFDDLDEELDTLFEDDEIRHGGAAMTAYAKLQFTEMSDPERLDLRNGLLKYCELDTFSMVLLCEYFLNALNNSKV